jgi:hypothetical protein
MKRGGAAGRPRRLNFPWPQEVGRGSGARWGHSAHSLGRKSEYRASLIDRHSIRGLIVSYNMINDLAMSIGDEGYGRPY